MFRTRPQARVVGVLAGAAMLAVTGAGTALASADTSEATGVVYAVHGIPDTPVDVYVDGELAIDDFEPGTSEGPLDLPVGGREVAIFPADAEDDSGDPLLSATADITEGSSSTLVAHLDTEGNPTLTPFTNDVSAVPAGEARLVVRHTAAAPAVDVLAGGEALLSDLTNPNQADTTAPAGTVEASVAAAGTTEPVIGPAEVTLPEGGTVFAHAIGSLEEDTLDLVVFTVAGDGSAPSGVPAGAPSGAPAVDQTVVAGLGALALAGVAVSVVAVNRRRVAGRR